MITGEADVLRDEGEAYANHLRAAGVPVTATRYQGIIHDFVMLNALRGTHAAEAAIRQAVDFLSEALALANRQQWHGDRVSSTELRQVTGSSPRPSNAASIRVTFAPSRSARTQQDAVGQDGRTWD